MKYFRSGNPLFIPEIQFNNYAGVNALYAADVYDAIGFSPFSIENGDETNSENLKTSYNILKQLESILVENQGTVKIIGVLAETVEQRQPQRFYYNGYSLNVTYERPANIPLTAVLPSGGIIIALGKDEFLIAGTGFVTVFEPNSPGEPIVGILSAQEGKFENGKWIGVCWLNGDQTHQGRHIRMESNKFSIQRVKLYRYH